MNYEDYRNAFTIVNESDGQPYTGAKGEYPFVIYNEEFMEKMNETGEFPQHMDALLKMVNEEFSKTDYPLEDEVFSSSRRRYSEWLFREMFYQFIEMNDKSNEIENEKPW